MYENEIFVSLDSLPSGFRTNSAPKNVSPSGYFALIPYSFRVAASAADEIDSSEIWTEVIEVFSILEMFPGYACDFIARLGMEIFLPYCLFVIQL